MKYQPGIEKSRKVLQPNCPAEEVTISRAEKDQRSGDARRN